MPEAWNQLTFDDQVHDIYTKGRKSPCHLIMDAWIKGIRRLRVIHYNYVEPRFVAELLLAAEIMGITLRIGIEFWARVRDRIAQLIWVPRGFADTQAFLCFLEEEPVAAFFSRARETIRYMNSTRVMVGVTQQPVQPDIQGTPGTTSYMSVSGLKSIGSPGALALPGRINSIRRKDTIPPDLNGELNVFHLPPAGLSPRPVMSGNEFFGQFGKENRQLISFRPSRCNHEIPPVF